jgi:hypothetical protein
VRTGRTLTLALAFGVLLVAVGMAGVSASHRAHGIVDKALMVALGCAVVGAVHLLPVLCRSKGAQALWLACLVLTLVDMVACGPMKCLRAVLIHLMAIVLWREALSPDSIPEPVTLVDGEPKVLVTMKPEPGTTIH